MLMLQVDRVVWPCFGQTTVLSECKNFIHTKIFTPGSSNFWFLTCIYGCPSFAERRGLWDKISAFRPPATSPWCPIGDFN